MLNETKLDIFGETQVVHRVLWGEALESKYVISNNVLTLSKFVNPNDLAEGQRLYGVDLDTDLEGPMFLLNTTTICDRDPHFLGVEDEVLENLKGPAYITFKFAKEHWPINDPKI